MWMFLKIFLMNIRGGWIICWKTLNFYKHQLNWVQPQLCLIWNLFFLKIYSTNPYDFMLEILFRTNLFFWYIKILLESFSFWYIENVKPTFQLRYALCLQKKECMKCEKGNGLLWKIFFETFLSNLLSNLPPIPKNNFHKALFQSAKKIRKIT